MSDKFVEVKNIQKWTKPPELKKVEYKDRTYVVYDPTNPRYTWYENYGWKRSGILYLTVIETDNDIFWHIHTVRVIYFDPNRKTDSEEEFDWSWEQGSRIELVDKERIFTFPKNIKPLPK